MDDDTISPAELHGRIERGETVTVLDVRDRNEFETWRIGGESVTATQVPEMRFVQADVKGTTAGLVADLPEPIVAVCARGEASGKIARQLREAGVEAVNLAGGMGGWARVYVARELDVDAAATVVQYRRPASGCLSYLVVDGGEAVVIDPLRAFADRYVDDARARGADVVAAVDTHVHADHVSGIRAVAGRTDADTRLPASARERGLAFEADLYDDGETITVGDAELEAIHAPGHTSELCVLRLGDVLFSADALFVGGVGRPDLEAGTDGAEDLAERLYETLQDRVLALPDDTLVAPGHAAESDDAYSERLGALERRLGALSMDRERFVEFVTDDLPPRPANHERIVMTNLGREELADEEAFEVELGPNNCAVADAS
jgi:glyoxylase-like metal-dependent hydrolase (beta-lactamase superfamily II)